MTRKKQVNNEELYQIIEEVILYNQEELNLRKRGKDSPFPTYTFKPIPIKKLKQQLHQRYGLDPFSNSFRGKLHRLTKNGLLENVKIPKKKSKSSHTLNGSESAYKFNYSLFTKILFIRYLDYFKGVPEEEKDSAFDDFKDSLFVEHIKDSSLIKQIKAFVKDEAWRLKEEKGFRTLNTLWECVAHKLLKHLIIQNNIHNLTASINNQIARASQKSMWVDEEKKQIVVSPEYEKKILALEKEHSLDKS